MAKIKIYKTFAELKKSNEKTSVSKKRLEEMTLDLEDFVKKIRFYDGLEKKDNK